MLSAAAAAAASLADVEATAGASTLVVSDLCVLPAIRRADENCCEDRRTVASVDCLVGSRSRSRTRFICVFVPC